MDQRNFILHYGDLTDATNLISIIQGNATGGTLQPGGP
ncbi:MAG: hypothetical protein QF675_06240, partial [SAR324 cluster bacterium]|nr:hypothetical protein [SAR324 cluster bacterium]